MEKNKRILIIDDEAEILELLADLLTDAGYTVITASNPSLDAITEYKVDCIILDLQLSAENAFEGGSILTYLWKDAFCYVPIIVFSGFLGIPEIDESLKQIEQFFGKGRNIFRCVSKFEGIKSLIDAVNECLGQSSAHLMQCTC